VPTVEGAVPVSIEPTGLNAIALKGVTVSSGRRLMLPPEDAADLRLCRRHMAARIPITNNPATPPTVPPTIAPTCDFDFDDGPIPLGAGAVMLLAICIAGTLRNFC
jgi:hypothetical protein